MKQSIGFMEYRSIAIGVEVTDAMLKSGDVRLLQSGVLCPGKYVVMIAGAVGAVDVAIRVGMKHDPATFLDSTIIANIHASILPALTGTTSVIQHGAFGIIETIDATAAIIAADTAVKTADIDLLEIRLARGMGGKGYVSLCGELMAVTSAVNQAMGVIGKEGLLVASSIIASPHEQLRF